MTVRFDLFPANTVVTCTADRSTVGRHGGVRVVAHDDGTLVLWGLADGRPTRVLTGRILTDDLPAGYVPGRGAYTVHLDDDRVVYVGPGRGCGCSSPLKHLDVTRLPVPA